MKKIELGFVASCVIAAFFSFLIFFVVIASVPEKTAFDDFLYLARLQPALLIINFAPIALCMASLWFLFNNVLLASVITAFIFCVMAQANRLKILLRQDPFTPADLTLVTEALSIFKNFEKSYVIALAGGIVAAVALIAVILIFTKGKPLNLSFRFFGLSFCLIASVIAYFNIYSSDEKYNKYQVIGNPYFKVNQYTSKGFIYSFARDISSLKVKKPDNYNKSVYDKETRDYAETFAFDENFRPNIIMVMGEAFSDLSENPNINFEGYADPLENFKSLANESGALSGRLVVPNFGGGTADTEFDVLSGCPTRYVYNDLTSYNFIRKPFNALPRIFKKAGYSTTATHPGYPWFYNRENVYGYFGFDKFNHLENAFDPEKENKGLYISDEAAVDVLISDFEEHKKANPDKPVFSFAVTIQNHGPFEYKYGIDKPNFNSSKELDEKQKDMLSNYFLGNIDADKQLRRLAEYFRKYDEPTIIAYFGDHLPGFTDGTRLMKDLGYNFTSNGSAKERIAMYKTPYLVWCNDKAQESLNIRKAAEEIGWENGGVISSNYLGFAIAQLIGFKNVSPIYDFENALRQSLPMITRQAFMLNDGTFKELEELTDEQLADVEKMKGWTYYNIFDAEGVSE